MKRLKAINWAVFSNTAGLIICSVAVGVAATLLVSQYRQKPPTERVIVQPKTLPKNVEIKTL